LSWSARNLPTWLRNYKSPLVAGGFAGKRRHGCR
jgi:hypothetical protein